MRRNLERIALLAIVVVIGIYSVLFLGTAPDVSGQNVPLIFSLNEMPRSMPAESKNSPASLKEAAIQVRFESFSEPSSRAIGIPLFDGKTYKVIRSESEGYERRSNDSLTWRGHISQDGFEGDVILTLHKGYLSGLIYSPDGVYEIAVSGGRQLLIKLDQSLYPECAGEVKPPAGNENAKRPSLGAVEDSGDRIDVLVVYTNAAKNGAGGQAAIEAIAQSAVDITNTAYLESKDRQRLRLVHTEETLLTESNTLSNLRGDSATQALRNTHNADMVAMLTNSLSGCGIGYLMTNVGSGFASSAYSITLRTCAVGNLTFAHELGHNMGSAHDPANAGSAAYSYSYGHFEDGSYRTVMSYSNQCDSGCSRVARFSNPTVVYNGVPSGIPGARNNARSLNNTADTVSNFRYRGSSLRLDNYSQDAFIPRNISKTLSWSSNSVAGNINIELSRNGGSTWETLVANTPNDGSETINVGGRPTKRVRLRISSVNDSTLSDSSVKNLSIK